MSTFAWVAVILGPLIGFVVGWVAARYLSRDRGASTTASARAEAAVASARADQERARADAERATGESHRLRAELAEVARQNSSTEVVVANAHREVAEANSRAADLDAQLRAAVAERDSAIARAAELAADREAMTNQFKVLSAETLERQGKVADETAEQRLQATQAMMAPLADQLVQLQTRLTTVEKERASMAAELRSQVATVVETGRDLRRETAALSTALRKPHIRGAWGETQLRRVAELSGMVEHCDFVQQATTTTSTDATIRPDMKVMLGEGKFVYVDSKVPLASFLDAFETTDENKRADHLARFARSVRTHVDQLSAKDYFKAGSGTPEFVVMFLPSEALAAEALSQAPDLHEYAFTKNVVIATPTVLIAMLRTIAYSWKQAALADSAAEVFELGRELYDRLIKLGGHVDKLGRAMTSSVRAYNQAVGALEGRVLVSARRFRDLQVSQSELAAPQGTQEAIRPLTAPELVASAIDDGEAPLAAGDDTAALGELISGESEPIDPAAELMARPSPSVDDLVEQTQPMLKAVRQLG